MRILREKRKFCVGKNNDITLKQAASIKMHKNDNISIYFDKFVNYDITKKDWGFYCLPSINKRLKRFNLKAVLTRNCRLNTYFIMLVVNEKKLIRKFKNYCKKEDLKLITWLDAKNLLKIKKIF